MVDLVLDNIEGCVGKDVHLHFLPNAALVLLNVIHRRGAEEAKKILHLSGDTDKGKYFAAK